MQNKIGVYLGVAWDKANSQKSQGQFAAIWRIKWWELLCNKSNWVQESKTYFSFLFQSSEN